MSTEQHIVKHREAAWHSVRIFHRKCCVLTGFTRTSFPGFDLSDWHIMPNGFWSFQYVVYLKLKIKLCGLGSRIHDMKDEGWRLRVITDKNILCESLVSQTGAEGWTEHWVKVPKSAPIYNDFGLYQPPQPQRSKMTMPMLSRKTFVTNPLK